jgi:drug/metabolite transporter superfamily protein YnfA
MYILKLIVLFASTAIAEIVGCYLPYLWLKKNGPVWLLTLHPTAAGRVYAAYGVHVTRRYANYRMEQSHQLTRVRVRGMRRFKSSFQAQQFLDVHAPIYNLFNLGRHLVSAHHYRSNRLCAFASWKNAMVI